jgi:hypothetical protein
MGHLLRQRFVVTLLGVVLLTALVTSVSRHAQAAGPAAATETPVAAEHEPWVPVERNRAGSLAIGAASDHPDGPDVQAIRCLGQHASPIPGGVQAPVHSPEDPAAALEFDVLPHAGGEAWFGMGHKLGTLGALHLGPVFGFFQGKFAVRQASFGEITSAPLRDGDTLDHWYRLRLVIDFRADEGRGSARLFVRNLSRGEKEFAPVIGPVSLGLDRLQVVARSPLYWESQYVRSDAAGKQGPELANVRPVAGRGIPADQAPSRSGFPQEHAYQRALLRYLGTLTEADLAIDVEPFTVPERVATPVESYRAFLLNNIYASPDTRVMHIPAAHLTLAEMDRGDSVRIPGIPSGARSRPDSVSYAWYATWDFPGNPYRGSRALKLRAFVLNAVDLMLLDRGHDEGKYGRSDFLAGTMIWLAWGHLQCRDVLPPPVRAAYEAGLRRMVDKLVRWGPTGLMTDMDLFVLVSMPMLCRVFPDDAAIRRTATELTERLVTNTQFFQPAGYFRDLGCFDVSYNGISLYMLTWSAALCDWPHVHEALAKAYRLRSHMVLPEVGGGYVGPSHFSSRTSGDAAGDQWNWPQRSFAAAALIDEALPALGMCEPNGLDAIGTPRHTKAEADLVLLLNRTLEAPRDFTQAPWAEAHWTSFPAYAPLLVTDELLERLVKLRDERSPLLLPAAARDERYVRDFGGEIVACKTDRYAAILFAGPVGGEAGKSFHGLGGGTLSAFGTAATGPLIVGRRGGCQGTANPDTYDEASLWPVHAITALTADGAYVSTARCRSPRVAVDAAAKPATLSVEGAIPSRKIRDAEALVGELTYTRRFTMHDDRLTVATTVRGDGRDRLRDMFETIPLYLGSPVRDRQPEDVAVLVERDGRWVNLTVEAVDGVRRLRLRRRDGVVDLSLDAPGRVQLASQNWQDRYQSRVVCRNILIHLPPPAAWSRDATQPWTTQVGWTLAPVP